jgi:hypothetical protein
MGNCGGKRVAAAADDNKKPKPPSRKPSVSNLQSLHKHGDHEHHKDKKLHAHKHGDSPGNPVRSVSTPPGSGTPKSKHGSPRGSKPASRRGSFVGTETSVHSRRNSDAGTHSPSGTHSKRNSDAGVGVAHGKHPSELKQSSRATTSSMHHGQKPLLHHKPSLHHKKHLASNPSTAKHASKAGRLCVCFVSLFCNHARCSPNHYMPTVLSNTHSLSLFYFFFSSLQNGAILTSTTPIWIVCGTSTTRTSQKGETMQRVNFYSSPLSLVFPFGAFLFISFRCMHFLSLYEPPRSRTTDSFGG